MKCKHCGVEVERFEGMCEARPYGDPQDTHEPEDSMSSFTAMSDCVYCGRTLALIVERPGVWVEAVNPAAPNTEHCYSYTTDGMNRQERLHYARADLPTEMTPEALERWLQS